MLEVIIRSIHKKMNNLSIITSDLRPFLGHPSTLEYMYLNFHWKEY